MLAWNAAGTSICAPRPKTTPAGLMKKKFGAAFAASSRTSPLICDAVPPVTRLTTLARPGVVVVNVADWEAPTLNTWKLWNRLLPDSLPSVSTIRKFGPASATAGPPSVPSVRIWACTSALAPQANAAASASIRRARRWSAGDVPMRSMS